VYNRNRVSVRQEASYCAAGIELLYRGIELLYNWNGVSVRLEPS
jgi:hypothetical protein